MTFAYSKSFDAYVVATLFDALDEPIAALGDGRIVFPDADAVFDAHPDAAILCAVVHPTGLGVISGGDDGRVVWTTKDTGPVELAHHKGAWIDAIAAAPEGQLVAYAAAKKAYVLDLLKKDTKTFAHEHSVSGLCFDPKGRKLYCATYNGVVVWYARIGDQKPQKLNWAGSHTSIAMAPSGEFLVTAMQENALHGWRLKDSKDMRMGGYPAKIKSMQFFARGKLLATSGAMGAVVWPFLKANGPMGEEASEINPDESTLVSVVAGAPEDTLMAAGTEDGRVWLAELQSTGIDWVKAEKGSPITALALSGEANRLLIGDEDGMVYIFESAV
ncbi:WD40 repeat domain-containing protein [Asticcacaulis sp. EMRT-3]|uniref:WD40 repeat domain-containing protein n=1 Tax=Asticcacaulis sp. EMRT-3 TaxID=3040349 RepID=UPI0024AFFBD6|nr:WD40 repeat domain-containing protein [Asticcacaulis sp. EMRT-3]MDI7775727.1 WD40 repeat domain-containing protein [Asticcacaulis sp. EMRT-3]